MVTLDEISMATTTQGHHQGPGTPLGRVQVEEHRIVANEIQPLRGRWVFFFFFGYVLCILKLDHMICNNDNNDIYKSKYIYIYNNNNNNNNYIYIVDTCYMILFNLIHLFTYCLQIPGHFWWIIRWFKRHESWKHRFHRLTNGTTVTKNQRIQGTHHCPWWGGEEPTPSDQLWPWRCRENILPWKSENSPNGLVNTCGCSIRKRWNTQ